MRDGSGWQVTGFTATPSNMTYLHPTPDGRFLLGAASPGPVAFTLRREAGTLSFTGEAGVGTDVPPAGPPVVPPVVEEPNASPAPVVSTACTR